MLKLNVMSRIINQSANRMNNYVSLKKDTMPSSEYTFFKEYYSEQIERCELTLKAIKDYRKKKLTPNEIYRIANHCFHEICKDVDVMDLQDLIWSKNGKETTKTYNK